MKRHLVLGVLFIALLALTGCMSFTAEMTIGEIWEAAGSEGTVVPIQGYIGIALDEDDDPEEVMMMLGFFDEESSDDFTEITKNGVKYLVTETPFVILNLDALFDFDMEDDPMMLIAMDVENDEDNSVVTLLSILLGDMDDDDELGLDDEDMFLSLTLLVTNDQDRAITLMVFDGYSVDGELLDEVTLGVGEELEIEFINLLDDSNVEEGFRTLISILK